MRPLNQFVDNGSDMTTVNHMEQSAPYPEVLEKAMDKTKLVQKEVQVKGKNGQTFTRKQWVKAGEEQKDFQYKLDKTNSGKVGAVWVIKPDGGKEAATVSNEAPHSFTDKSEVTVEGKPFTIYKNGNNLIAVEKSTKSTKPSDVNVKSSQPKATLSATGSSAKQQLVDMLASGKSREDIMSEFKSQGVTWKHSDNQGINWMRASMAIQKHMNNNSDKSQNIFDHKSASKTLSDICTTVRNGGDVKKAVNEAAKVLTEVPDGTILTTSGNRGVKFQYEKKNGKWVTSKGDEYTSEKFARLELDYAYSAPNSMELSTPEDAPTKDDIKASHDAAVNGQLDQILGISSKTKNSNNKNYTADNPKKVKCSSGKDYSLWKVGSTIYGSVPGNEKSHNARAIRDFSQAGFDSLEEVEDYVKKYF